MNGHVNFLNRLKFLTRTNYDATFERYILEIVSSILNIDTTMPIPEIMGSKNFISFSWRVKGNLLKIHLFEEYHSKWTYYENICPNTTPVSGSILNELSDEFIVLVKKIINLNNMMRACE